MEKRIPGGPRLSSLLATCPVRFKWGRESLSFASSQACEGLTDICRAGQCSGQWDWEGQSTVTYCDLSHLFQEAALKLLLYQNTTSLKSGEFSFSHQFSF